MDKKYTSDVLIIGTGVAGLSLAIRLAKNSDLKINMISKVNIQETNTKYAQGGIAAVLAKDDTIEAHVHDTLIAGDFLNRESVVREIISEGPSAIQFLIDLGVKFDKTKTNEIELGLEGGHLKRRVAHVHDYTGLEVENTLIKNVKNNPQINIFEYHTAIDLVFVNNRIAGAYVLDNKTQLVNNFSSKFTVLATGGAGKVFLYTSNPDIASGDGIAMAYRAGAVIANMEFIQFHPTLYYNPNFKTFLISEALRGEGAILKAINGKRFMTEVHELAELAPRDIVARAIDFEMKKTGDDHVFLDISFKDPAFIKERFPQIYETLLSKGLDITKNPIPIVPAAHYTMGGIRAKINGETNLPGLIAIGECTYTGLHGSNRLASNSLLEGIVMSKKASEFILDRIEKNSFDNYSFPPWQFGDAVAPDEAVIISNNWEELRRAMWNYVGIVRTTKRLLRAKKRIEVLMDEVNEYYWKYHVTSDIVELRNVVQVADLIVESALARKESRGAHFTHDYPDKLESKRDVLIQKIYGVHYSEEIKR